MTERITITPEMIRLYDEYTHVTLDRRNFMAKLSRVAGSTAAAAAIVPLLEANKASAAIVPPDDPSVTTERIEFTGASGQMTGYLALPADENSGLPAVIVIHENRGLNPHIEDVARRLAADGFAALAVDFLSVAGGTPEDEDRAREMIGELDAKQTLDNAVAAVSFMRTHPAGNGNVGAVGFCWGGGLVNQLATASEELTAGVVYYGRTPDSAAVPNIRARMLFHYAGLDERINEGRADYETALQAAGVEFESYLYDNVNHAFNNDTSSARYDQAAAELAWQRTTEFLHRHLGD